MVWSMPVMIQIFVVYYVLKATLRWEGSGREQPTNGSVGA